MALRSALNCQSPPNDSQRRIERISRRRAAELKMLSRCIMVARHNPIIVPLGITPNHGRICRMPRKASRMDANGCCENNPDPPIQLVVCIFYTEKIVWITCSTTCWARAESLQTVAAITVLKKKVERHKERSSSGSCLSRNIFGIHKQIILLVYSIKSKQK